MARRPRQLRPPVVIREHAAELAREAADQREKDGDPEGADILRELEQEIRKIPLSEIR